MGKNHPFIWVHFVPLHAIQNTSPKFNSTIMAKQLSIDDLINAGFSFSNQNGTIYCNADGHFTAEFSDGKVVEFKDIEGAVFSLTHRETERPKNDTVKISNLNAAVERLLSEQYKSEFETIDRMPQHPKGINFYQWLFQKDLISKSEFDFKQSQISTDDE